MITYQPSNSTDNKIAVFIDAENISFNNATRIIDILEKKGKILVREIVADWTKINVAKKSKDDNIFGWRNVAATYSMTAIQQFTYRPKKKSSDIALAIRAMKTLYEKSYIDTYCIVSNDCDFTRLAQELREHDKFVIGMGEQEKAIDEFIKAFSEYIYLDESINEDDDSDVTVPIAEEKDKEILPNSEPIKTKANETAKKTTAKAKQNSTADMVGEEKLTYLIETIKEMIDEKGLAIYSVINGNMKTKYPDFVPQNFGCKNFRQLMDALMPKLKMFEKTETAADFALIEKKK